MPNRLALYSDQLSPRTDAIDRRLMQWLAGTRGVIGYVPSSPDQNRVWFHPRQNYYARLGFETRFFGLEDEFHATERADLLACDAIHLSGGNTFRFLHWLHVRGLMADLQHFVAEGGVLIGVSAGAILMTPDVGSSRLCGDTPYPGLQGTSGLSLVDFAVVPHIDASDGTLKALANYSREFGGTVYGIPDGSGIIVDGAHRELLGTVRTAIDGQILS